MQISEFSLRIILLFIPGIISFIITERLTHHKEIKLHGIIIYSLILAFISYLFYGLLVDFLNSHFQCKINCGFFDVLTKVDSKIDFREIANVTILSIPVAFLMTFLINYKILSKVGHILHISKKHGDLDVWSYLMNSNIPEWVVIRDLSNDLMFQGWVQLFSDSTEKDEIFLRDVRVFNNSTAEELYEIPGLYFPRKMDNILIEFPSLEIGGGKKIPKKEEVKNV